MRCYRCNKLIVGNQKRRFTFENTINGDIIIKDYCVECLNKIIYEMKMILNKKEIKKI